VPLFMVVEHFRNGEAAPVYRRFKEHGRMAPDGLTYVSSWVDENLATCYQLMETADRTLLDERIRNWKDLVEFEVHPVISSQEAAQRVASLEA
jgi:isopentenyl diphosphate isomerase/L-lactate dehydrogenase-like FMN-dependent dehydrogenase